MAETYLRPRLVRFGAFEADVQTGELRKDGVKLRFGGQPFQVLAILLERPGEVVTREELQKRLWPDTFVDVERNLNTAVNKIREVLGDSAESPRFVETLPRRGYRFIGELERRIEPVVGTAAEPVMSIRVEPARRSDFRKLWWKVAAGIAIIAIVVAVIYLRSKPQRPQEQAVLTAVPFTALPGAAISPAFSPDGSRIAFAWNGDSKGGAKGFDLYVKVIGSETLLRLTQHPSHWISAAWSPDGTQIVFHRLAGTDTGLYVVPALGGPERKLRSTLMRSGPEPMALDYSIVSWSLDGKWIVFADELPKGDDVIRMYLLSTETLETKQAPIGPKCDQQGMPAFSHNGKYLAYWCFPRLYSLPFPDGEPKMIATFREYPSYPSGLTWSADGKRLIYSVWNARSYILGEVSVANGSVKRLDFAGNASQPTVSSNGDKLAFRTSYLNSKILRRDLLQPESRAVELIPSSRAQFDAQYSPDGKRIAFASLRSGLQGVWISNEDGSNLVQISNPAYMSGSPQWSPDGNKIAFDSHDSLSLDRWEIYVADVADRKPRKLVTNVFGLVRPHWSRDGKWIYFRSQEPGTTGVYRCPSSGGDAVAISKDPDGISPQESFDGKTVYFASLQQELTLKKVALQAQPGAESEVDGLPHVSGSSLWALSPGGIYFVAAAAPKSLRYFDFAIGQIRPIFEMDNDFGGTLSVSPDGRWILYSQAQAGEVNSDIMLVDNFH